MMIFWWADSLCRPAKLIQTPISTPAKVNSKGWKCCSFRSNCSQNYVIIIYVRRLNRSRFKVASKVKFPAGLGVKNGWAVPNWKRRFWLIQTPKFSWSKFGKWKFRCPWPGLHHHIIFLARKAKKDVLSKKLAEKKKGS